LNAIVPFEIAGSQTVGVEVRANGAASNAVQVPVLASEPAIIGSLGFARALNQDGTRNSQNNPAQLGSIVSLFVNGAGLQTPTPADGTLATFGPRPELPVSVQASAATGYFAEWQNCELLYAGAAPGELAGLLQVNVRLPTAQVAVGGQTAILVTVGNLSAISAISATSQ
jgi:uncharacterized protein (TIGR03437 family)